MHTPGFCAIIVAGGKSSRLGNTPKAGLSNGTHTLLDRALLAVSQADACVVVGPETLPVPNDVLLTREDPPYSGPAAAIHAGAEKLAQHYSGIGHPAPTWCIILGVDTPNIAPAVSLLAEHAGAAAGHETGFWGICDGVYQPLVGIYRYAPLRQVFSAGSTNASVRSFLKQLHPQEVELSPAHTADVDTWEQARALGFDSPQGSSY